jgi:hypothetical protein
VNLEIKLEMLKQGIYEHIINKITEREIQELIYQQTILASEKGGKSK